MFHTMVLLRLGCFAFGFMGQLLLPKRLDASVFGAPGPVSRQLLHIVFHMSKVTACCAIAALVVPLPVPTSVLYTGGGIGAACMAHQEKRAEEWLVFVCTWIILYLPVTGALACLGGGMLVLAADVPEMAGLAVLVLAAPMAFLQFGPEGALVLLGSAALLGTRRVRLWWCSVYDVSGGGKNCNHHTMQGTEMQNRNLQEN